MVYSFITLLFIVPKLENQSEIRCLYSASRSLVRKLDFNEQIGYCKNGFGLKDETINGHFILGMLIFVTQFLDMS